MSTSKESYTVNIIVYGAKGLKPKKDKHKFCVIYGIGKIKHRTEIVEDLFDNPVFNKETEIKVSDTNLELKFKVTEKHEKDVLGQVIVPLYELGDHETSSPHKVPLRPHKRCPTPRGMLIFEAWIALKKVEVTPTRVTSTESLKSTKSLGLTSGFKKLKDRISHSNLLSSSKNTDEKNNKNSSESLFTLKSRSAISCQDLTSGSPFYIAADGLRSDNLEVVRRDTRVSELSVADAAPKRHSLHLEKVSEFICPNPEVTGISPTAGPETGGTVVTIRGSNLGQNKDDIVGLYVCGADVLDTLEYVSSSKLLFTTIPWQQCIGSVNIETLSGGRGTSVVHFTFTEVNESRSSSISENVFHSDSIFDATERTDVAASRASVGNIDDINIVSEFYENSRQAAESSDRVLNETTKQEMVSIKSGNNGGDDDLTSSGSDFENRRPSLRRIAAPPKNIFEEIGEKIVSPIPTVSIFVSSPPVIDVDNKTSCFKSNGSHNALSDDAEKLGRGMTMNSSNSITVKQPPPVVEIQPMRMDDQKTTVVVQSNGVAPKKPPRQVAEKRNETSQRSDNTKEVLIHNQQNLMITETDDNYEKHTGVIRDLKARLSKKDEEIKLLLDLKKGLQEDNWRLSQYIEILVSRAIIKCPEVLCIDNSFA